jgi:hypothetical protein
MYPGASRHCPWIWNDLALAKSWERGGRPQGPLSAFCGVGGAKWGEISPKNSRIEPLNRIFRNNLYAKEKQNSVHGEGRGEVPRLSI